MFVHIYHDDLTTIYLFGRLAFTIGESIFARKGCIPFLLSLSARLYILHPGRTSSHPVIHIQ